MHKSAYTIFVMICITALSACTPNLSPPVDRDPITAASLTVTESQPSPQEESPSPSTEIPSTTANFTPESMQTETVITEDDDNGDTSATSTVMPSLTKTMKPSATDTLRPSATNTFDATELLMGSFYGVDEDHQGTGNAIIIQTGVDEYSLQLVNFEVTSGPGLHVILGVDSNPYSVATLGDYLDLGELKSISGDQTYSIPSDVNLENYGSVVIYCVPFEAIFAIAPLQ